MKISEIKKNIRRFSGFTFKKDSPEFERKKNYVDKLVSWFSLSHIIKINALRDC